MSNTEIFQYKRRGDGRVFVVGDIHGHYSQLARELLGVRFDYDKDILITLGDTIDRGPESLRCLHLCLEPWVIPILGNHEDMMFEALLEMDYSEWVCWQANGGDWWTEGQRVTPAMKEFLLKCRDAHHVRVEIDGVGFCHAMPPRDWHFPEENEECDQRIIWGRKYVGREVFIKHVNHVYVGHVPHDEVTTIGNITYCDTGFWIPYSTNEICLVEVNNEYFNI